jgi:hypothetical protein
MAKKVSLFWFSSKPKKKSDVDKIYTTGNESFILGYGFVPSPNPADDVVLKLGVSAQSAAEGLMQALEEQQLKLDERHVVGMNGQVPEKLWRTIRTILRSTTGEDVEDGEDAYGDLKTDMDTADTLVQMLESKIDVIQGLIQRSEVVGDTFDGGEVVGGEKNGVRKEVWEMCGRYLQGMCVFFGKA